jgi:hypothetical protein
LIQKGKRLELLRLFDLFFEPVLDLILLCFLEILVVVVEMPRLGVRTGESRTTTGQGGKSAPTCSVGGG